STLYTIRVDYRHDRYEAGIKLYWMGPNFPESILDTTYLHHYASGLSCPCQPACSQYGTCYLGRCECDGLHTGANCTLLQCQGDECRGNDNCRRNGTGSAYSVCNGQGTCYDGVCTCDAGSGLSSVSQCTERGCPGNG